VAYRGQVRTGLQSLLATTRSTAGRFNGEALAQVFGSTGLGERPRYGEGVAEPAVVVRGMRVGYGEFVVLDDVNLTVAEGEIAAVTGVNGAGKSTLLSCLAGLHRPSAGTLTVLGSPPRDDAAFWRAVALVADCRPGIRG
jgi:ABC-type transport system involved in cytochrome bd biosynthesis fused ATPase/permease subunit